MNLVLGRDDNGNKNVKVKVDGHRAFSIKTMGNLFYTHRMSEGSFNYDIAKEEVLEHIKQYGTKTQKKLLEWK